MDDWVVHGPTAAVAGGAFWLVYAIIKRFLGKTAYELRLLGEKIDTLREETWKLRRESQLRRYSDG